MPGQLVGVVGPNGCGKSNVIDAVRWVLGESRASALRGDSMQDVIFNGSVNRKPLARASVELIFDNSQGRAAGQWSQYAEISVKRTLQRDGESSYFINGTHVRRRDITDMFLGTGLGPRAYAIIEQGMISRVIEAKPEELRVFLEEAAGISRYKERRRETENRLADTRENLARITDIRLELGAQLEKLEAQAKVATRYKEYHSDLQLKQHLLWYLRRRDAAAERERHAQEVSRITNELEAQNAELRSVEARLETARGCALRGGRQRSTRRRARCTPPTPRSRASSRSSGMPRKRAAASRASTRSGARSSPRGASSAPSSRFRCTPGQRAPPKRKCASRRSANGLIRKETCCRRPSRQFRGAQERLEAARSALSQAESRLQLEQANFAHLERGRQSLEQRRERLEAELQTLAEPEAGAIQNLDELQQALAAAQQAFEELQSEYTVAEEQRATAAETLGAAQREHAAAQAQLDTLRQIQAAAEDNAPLHDWLGRHGLAHAARLWQKLRIDQGWETAVESVLRERLHALELPDASRLSAALADRPPVKASVFDHGTRPSATPAAGLPLMTKIHATDPAVAGALADWLAGVVAIEGTPDPRMREALPPGVVMVNRDGHQFTRHTVSFHAPDPADAGILARQAEIEELEKRCSELASRLASAESEQRGREEEVSSRLDSLEQARAGISERQKALHDAQIENVKLSQAQERYRERSSQVRAELDEVQAEAARGSEALAVSQATSTRVAEEIAQRKTEADAAREALATADSALAAQRSALQQAEREAQDALFGERECSSKIAEIDNSVRVIDQQITRADAEVARLNEELAADPIPGVRESLACCRRSKDLV